MVRNRPPMLHRSTNRKRQANQNRRHKIPKGRVVVCDGWGSVNDADELSCRARQFIMKQINLPNALAEKYASVRQKVRKNMHLQLAYLTNAP